VKQLHLQVVVNGIPRQAEVPVWQTLASFLREDLRLTGTHLGCEHGVCGACTVLLDGEPVRSCLLFAVQANGHEVLTVEGLAQNSKLHPIQRAFQEHHGLQCGFCTSGFLLATLALLREHPSPTVEEIRRELAGNLCRCTGYQHIVASVLAASELMREGA